MPEIKTRETVKDIKILDKASVAGERMKHAFIRSKDTAQNLMDDGQVSPSEYAEDKIRYTAEDVAYDTGHTIKKETDKAVDKGREVFREHRREKRLERQEKKADEAVRRYEQRTEQNVSQAAHQTRSSVRAKDTTIKTAQRTEHTVKQTAKSTGKATIKTADASIKSTQKAVKTAEKTSKAAIKTAETTAKATKKAAEAAAKTAQKAAIAAKQAAIAAYKAAVVVGKAIVAAVKALIAAIKELVAAIAAGGWVAVVVIIVICLVALIVGSCFGIFFSSEDTGSNMTMQQVVRDINEDYQNRIESIKANNPYDDLEMSGSRAVWPQVLSIYAVKTTTDPDNAMEVATMTDEKKQLLTDIFWAMNDISYRTETRTETEIVESDDGNGNILEEEVEVTHTTLYIVVAHKDADAMASQYNFSADQNKQLGELLAADNSMWLAVLYGIYGSDDMIVQIALTQIGNVGGEPYWSWYGFSSRVEWCACFVSWCADQCGYIENGIIPKYAGCVTGVNWFKQRNQWADNSIEPTPGMIIFFDWDNKGGSGPQDGLSDHTGIVERVENGIVYTVEGNTSDSCAERHYSVGYYEILGYGIPAY
ncbi:MAG: CHAP domain-containing protein [Mogibacterium sp.]|nr:CHAP domain-containing protein [Mogibacterium sp.]